MKIWGGLRQQKNVIIACLALSEKPTSAEAIDETFNGTLKSMLRKTAVEGKDWDKLQLIDLRLLNLLLPQQDFFPLFHLLGTYCFCTGWLL